MKLPFKKSKIEAEQIEKAPKTKMDSKKKKRIVRVVVLAGVISLVVGGVVMANTMKKNVKMPVYTKSVIKGDVEETVSTSGLVESEETKIYYAATTSLISEMDVALGDAVKTAQQLVLYDTDKLADTQKQTNLEAKRTTSQYQDAIEEGKEKAADFTSASNNVEAYKSMIVAQRAYVNNLDQFIAQKKVNASADVQKKMDDIRCQMDSIYGKQEKAQKELNSLKEPSASGATISGNEVRAKELSDELTGLSTEFSRLSNAIASVYNDVDTIAEDRGLVDARQWLEDMNTYYNEDKSKKSSAENGILSGNKRAELEATKEISKLSAEIAQKNLEQASKGVLSEFDGIITEVYVEKGAAVTEGSKLFKVESSSDVRVNISVSKYDLEKIKVGQTAEIDLVGSNYTGKVTKINRMAKPKDNAGASGTPMVDAQIHIDNPDDNIYLGVEAKVIIKIADAKDVLLAPVEAINIDKEGSFCYVVENDIVVKKRVTTGLSSDSLIQILDGLAEDAQLITEVSSGIEEGTAVMIMPDASALPADTQAGADETGNAEAAVEEKTEEGSDAEAVQDSEETSEK